MQTIHIDRQKRCAFCKYWDDPANAAISPHPNAEKSRLWSYDPDRKNKCLASTMVKRGNAVCNRYVCKITI